MNGEDSMKIDNQNISEIINQNGVNEVWRNASSNVAPQLDSLNNKENDSYQILHSNEIGNTFESIGSKSDVQEMAELDEAKHLKKQVEKITNTTTAADCNKLNEEGKSLYDTEVEEIVTVVDKIKIAMAQSKDYQNYGEKLDSQAIEEVVGNGSLANSLVSKFEENDIPATKENISTSMEALNRAQNLQPLTDANVQYMLRNQLEPTISNLYKAQYSGNVEYQNPDTNKINWESLEASMTTVIQEAGYEVNAQNLEDAKWMIESQIPFTKETYGQMKALENIEIPVAIEDTMDAIVTAIQEGKKPENANIVNTTNMLLDGQKMLEAVNNISLEQVSTLIDEDVPLTIQAFQNIQNDVISKTTSSEVADTQQAAISQDASVEQTTVNNGLTSLLTSENGTEINPALITAARQLEEIRLKMTLDSVVQMMKQGIQVDTQELEQLVENLRALEKQSYEQIFSSAQVEPTDENIQLYQETNQTVESLKGVPSYVLGRDVLFTVKDVNEEGNVLKADLQKANQAYETLMTSPRTDMGDSIQKAFQNVETILDDLGLEKTDANVRAVKILGYNSMEITEESLMQIKEKDTQVQNLMQKLTPSVTLELIRKGINPLETDINELNKIVEDIKNKSGIGEEEKFSSYLYKLEQNNEISEEERSSYIGIYRLLNQVEKTDGAAVGALVNQGAEITLKNLMTSVRTLKSQGIDTKVDDQFGTLEELNVQGTNIINQIETAYYSQLVGTTLDVITPNKLKTVVNEQGNFTAVEEMPFETFAQGIQKAEEEQEIKSNYAKMQLAEFAKIQSVEDDVIKMLNDYELPVTMDNLLAADSALKGKGKAYRKLYEEAQKDTDLAEVIKETFERFTDSLSTPEEMAKAQNDLAETAENVMKGMLEEVEVSSLDIREMKLVNQEIQIGTSMSKDEHYTIPIMVGDNVATMSLKIVRGEEEKGIISIAMDTEETGKLTARLQVSQKGISGYVSNTSTEILDKLKELETELSAQMQEETEIETEISINYIPSEFTKTDIYQKQSSDENSQAKSEIQTSQLYQVAKAFVVNVQKLFV